MAGLTVLYTKVWQLLIKDSISGSLEWPLYIGLTVQYRILRILCIK
jgi:hypothetical protein